jgi:hypothetical protein
MGTVVHHAIIVTGWKEALLVELADLATKLGACVIGPSAEVTNGYRTLVICPDGSKSGWAASDKGDETRTALKTWMDTKRCEDRSSSLEWLEVAYGNDRAGNDCPPSIEDDVWRRR